MQAKAASRAVTDWMFSTRSPLGTRETYSYIAGIFIGKSLPSYPRARQSRFVRLIRMQEKPSHQHPVMSRLYRNHGTSHCNGSMAKLPQGAGSLPGFCSDYANRRFWTDLNHEKIRRINPAIPVPPRSAVQLEMSRKQDPGYRHGRPPSAGVTLWFAVIAPAPSPTVC